MRTNQQQNCLAMRPLYAARLEDLGPKNRIKVECAAYRRVSLIAATGLGLPPKTALLDLKPSVTVPRMRCSQPMRYSIEWAKIAI
jgi:hypothetical protein